nr:LuxR C-terminal-related transcriptional regulator [Gloeobacter violaceus]
MISLQQLFEEIHQIEGEENLQSHLAPKIGAYFAAQRSGIFLFDRLLSDRKLRPVLNVALSIERNPIARYIAERHTPVHEGLVTSPRAWALVCPRPDHWHVMAGPVLDRNQLVGAVGCTRARSMPAFDHQNLTDLSAICLHLSVWTTTARASPKPQFQTLAAHRLTPRELQIAGLVALGRTNAEIGTELWITENSVKQALKRMYRKLEVTSRTEMITQLLGKSSRFPEAIWSQSTL